MGFYREDSLNKQAVFWKTNVNGFFAFQQKNFHAKYVNVRVFPAPSSPIGLCVD
jgi:hypothetical protein